MKVDPVYLQIPSQKTWKPSTCPIKGLRHQTNVLHIEFIVKLNFKAYRFFVLSDIFNWSATVSRGNWWCSILLLAPITEQVNRFLTAHEIYTLHSRCVVTILFLIDTFHRRTRSTIKVQYRCGQAIAWGENKACQDFFKCPLVSLEICSSSD